MILDTSGAVNMKYREHLLCACLRIIQIYLNDVDRSLCLLPRARVPPVLLETPPSPTAVRLYWEPFLFIALLLCYAVHAQYRVVFVAFRGNRLLGTFPLDLIQKIRELRMLYRRILMR